MARPRSEEARQKALDATQELVAEVGIDGFTVDAVARRSGVAKTTIYRHWPNGHALLLDSIDCMVQSFPTPNTGDLAKDLRLFIDDVSPEMSDPGMRQMMLGVLALSASDPEFAEAQYTLMRERMTPVITMLELAKARGEIPEHVDLELALAFVEGPFFFRNMIQDGLFDDDSVTTLIDLVVAGLKNAPPPASA